VDEFSDPTPIATAEQFKAALLVVRDSVADINPYLAMLRAHCHAPSHTITAVRLAQEVGYPSYSAANLQYGTFAHYIADALHYRPGPFSDGNPHWWRTLAYGGDETQSEDGYYEWIMRPELVQALQEMGWV
jgi:hypothetical protein